MEIARCEDAIRKLNGIFGTADPRQRHSFGNILYNLARCRKIR